MQVSTWWWTPERTSFLMGRVDSLPPLFKVELLRQSVSISGIKWEESIQVRHAWLSGTHKTNGTPAEKKEWYKLVYFCRLSDFVHEVDEWRAGEDLLWQCEPGRCVAPRQREHHKQPRWLAGTLWRQDRSPTYRIDFFRKKNSLGQISTFIKVRCEFKGASFIL